MSVRHALLGLIMQKPRHGYDLHAAFTSVVGGEQNWEVKIAQIYTTLTRLKDAGLIVEESIEQDGGPEKRIYAITDLGRNELKAWLNRPVKNGRGKDEFFIKLMISIASGEEKPIKIVYNQRNNLYKELHDLNAIRLQIDSKVSLAYLLLVEQTIMHIEADIKWLDVIEAKIDDIQKQPLPKPEIKPRGRPTKV